MQKNIVNTSLKPVLMPRLIFFLCLHRAILLIFLLFCVCVLYLLWNVLKKLWWRESFDVKITTVQNSIVKSSPFPRLEVLYFISQRKNLFRRSYIAECSFQEAGLHIYIFNKNIKIMTRIFIAWTEVEPPFYVYAASASAFSLIVFGLSSLSLLRQACGFLVRSTFTTRSIPCITKQTSGSVRTVTKLTRKPEYCDPTRRSNNHNKRSVSISHLVLSEVTLRTPGVYSREKEPNR